MLGKRLVVVSNRLPVAVVNDGQTKTLKPSSGGLVTALNPILESEGGLWIGWPGMGEDEEIRPLAEQYNRDHTYKIHPIPLTEAQVDRFYLGFSNQTIWPLFHDFLGTTHFDVGQWEEYDKVNRIYAEHIAEEVGPGDFIWVHDYQLMRVAYHLRKLGVEQPIAYFHHIPFPAPDLYRRLPWAQQIFNGTIQYDSIGFQTLRDRRNFVALARERLRKTNFRIQRRHTTFTINNRKVHVGNYPISIDFDEFDRGARSNAVKMEMEVIRQAYQVDHLVLGLDRLDYTKGIPQRFLAFERLLEKFPELQGKISLIQVVVPSRTQVKTYSDLKEQLDQLTGRINGRFGRHGYVPIHYFFKHLNRSQLLALYSSCEIALITPLRDGMNLVAKEYAAASGDHRNVLVLSMFTGSADQLGKSALLVNPYDLEGTANTLHRALHMDPRERRRRMRDLRTQIRRNDVHRWVKWVMGALTGVEVQDIASELEGKGEAPYDPDPELSPHVESARRAREVPKKLL